MWSRTSFVPVLQFHAVSQLGNPCLFFGKHRKWVNAFLSLKPYILSSLAPSECLILTVVAKHPLPFVGWSYHGHPGRSSLDFFPFFPTCFSRAFNYHLQPLFLNYLPRFFKVLSCLRERYQGSANLLRKSTLPPPPSLFLCLIDLPKPSLPVAKSQTPLPWRRL